MKIALIHLDLGIGGAERLVVNIALCLKRMGHDVRILTSHHDPTHCFEETAPGGSLHNNVHVIGGWIPHRLFFGRFTALLAIIRVCYIALYLLCHPADYPECVFLDGVSAPTPLLYFANIPVLFYCHFPDLLLCVDRGGWLKRAYRFVIDTLEEYTLGCADILFVNSEYTSSVVRDVFPRIHRFAPPIVLYPTLDMVQSTPPPPPPSGTPSGAGADITPVKDETNSEENSPNPVAESSRYELSRRAAVSDSPESVGSSAISPFISRPIVHTTYTQGYDFVFVSLNRYERKKRVEVALDAFAQLKRTLAQKAFISASQTFDPETRQGSVQLVRNAFLQLPAVSDLASQLKFDALEATLRTGAPSELTGAKAGISHSFYDRLLSAYSEDDLSTAIANARVLLVVAGGYDTNVSENIQYLKELKSYASNLGLCYTGGDGSSSSSGSNSSSSGSGSGRGFSGAVDVVFRTSISTQERLELLRGATALLYTPDNEHFGIVPLEAMNEGCPVVAVASGGPKETVASGETGFLCQQTGESFSAAMLLSMLPVSVVVSQSPSWSGSVVVPLSVALGVMGKMRVTENFSSGQMEQTLSRALRMFMHRLLPVKSRRQAVSMIQNEAERDQLLGNIHRSSYYSRCVSLFTISVLVLLIAFVVYLMYR